MRSCCSNTLFDLLSIGDGRLGARTGYGNSGGFLGEVDGFGAGFAFREGDGECAVEGVAGGHTVNSFDLAAGIEFLAVAAPAAFGAHGDGDVLDAAFNEDFRGFLGALGVGDFHAGQKLGFRFVGRDPVDELVEGSREFAGGSRIEDHGDFGLMSDFRGPFHSFDGSFQLHEKNGRGFDLFLEGLYVLGRKRAVGAQGYGDDVLAFLIDHDERGAGGLLLVDDQSRRDGVLFETGERFAAEDVVADFGDETAGAFLFGEPGYGYGLVGALAARIEKEMSTQYRLAWHGDLFARNYHVSIGGA